MYRLSPKSWLIIAALMGLLAPLPILAAQLNYGWQKVDGIDIFYREGGPADAPTVVFLHGNPLSSIQYEKVMEGLAEVRHLHVLAMDYPAYGYSDVPDPKSFTYSFDNLAVTVRHFIEARGIRRYALYMQDYGVPVGFRLIEADPKRVTAIMVQNGIIHLEGFPAAQDPNSQLRRHWAQRDPAADQEGAAYIRSQTYPSARNAQDALTTDPDAMLLSVASAQRPGVVEAQLDLWADYGSNLPLYPKWQALLKKLKLPVLVIWGDKDKFFTVPGAEAYRRDAPQAEIHVIHSGHFATLDSPDEVSQILVDFTGRHSLE